MFKLIKLFDSENMPQDIQVSLYNSLADIRWKSGFSFTWHFEDDMRLDKDALSVQNWLLKNGATINDKYVLIKTWY